MYNTIILYKTEGEIEGRGESIFDGSPRTELGRWQFSRKEEAFEALNKHKSFYRKAGTMTSSVIFGTEYFLEFCDTAEDGEWEDGSEYELADERPEHSWEMANDYLK